MKKNMIIFLVVLFLLFGALWFVVDYQNKKQSEGNPYGKDNLHPATVEQLDNPNYQNQILPDDLEETLANEESITVYFYDPTCPHCQQLTPDLVPLADEMGVDMKKLNVLEFEAAWDTYNISGTPTLIHFENGQEVARLDSAAADFEAFFNQYVLDEQEN